MEKIALIFFLVFVLLVVVLPLSLIIKLITKSKASSWSGIVIDKKHNTTEDMDDKVTENYFVVVKMDNGGRDRNIAMSPTMWKDFKIGDKIKKLSGEMLPKKG